MIASTPPGYYSQVPARSGTTDVRLIAESREIPGVGTVYLLRRDRENVGRRLQLAGLLEEDISPSRLLLSHLLDEARDGLVGIFQVLVRIVDLVHHLMRQI